MGVAKRSPGGACSATVKATVVLSLILASSPLAALAQSQADIDELRRRTEELEHQARVREQEEVHRRRQREMDEVRRERDESRRKLEDIPARPTPEDERNARIEQRTGVLLRLEAKVAGRQPLNASEVRWMHTIAKAAQAGIWEYKIFWKRLAALDKANKALGAPATP
jgi:hypothetical protein